MGACLAHAGDDVTLVVRPETASTYPDNLELESPFGSFRVPVAHTTEVPPTDILWLTVKATQLDSALASIPANVAMRAIVPLLNGVDHIEKLRSRFGADRVIAATIAVEAERVRPGHIAHRSPFARLNISAKGRSLLASTVEKLQKIGFDCSFSENEPTLLWSKLVFLGPIALTTSAQDVPIGGLTGDPARWQELEACIREACTVATSEGATVDAEKGLAFIRTMPRSMKSSMQKDVEQGKQPELDAIGGAIVRAARRHGHAVPVTENLIKQVGERIRSR
jgi:2-dehydropantoate 2-reductase